MEPKHLTLLFFANTIVAAAIGASTYALLSRQPAMEEKSVVVRATASGSAAPSIAKMATPKPPVESEPDSAPCADDLKKFCKQTDMPKGPMGCLGSHLADLSPACIAVVKQSQGGLAAKCGAEISQFCQNVEMREGRMLRCLRENIAKLGNGCKKKIDQI